MNQQQARIVLAQWLRITASSGKLPSPEVVHLARAVSVFVREPQAMQDIERKYITYKEIRQ
jgi:hypothetical protein